MTKLEKIEESVAALSDEELRQFAVWFADLQWARWDRQLDEEADALLEDQQQHQDRGQGSIADAQQR